MIKTFGKAVYNTETAELVCKYVKGYFGDPAGYEESLYKTEGGKFFLYVCGGAASKYPKEDIKRVSADKAKEMM